MNWTIAVISATIAILAIMTMIAIRFRPYPKNTPPIMVMPATTAPLATVSGIGLSTWILVAIFATVLIVSGSFFIDFVNKENKEASKTASLKSLADEISRRELEKEATSVKTPVAVINLHPEQGESMDTRTLPAGIYSVSPSNSEVRIEGKWSNLEEGGVLRLQKETAVGFFPPRGTRTVSIYRKEGG